MREALESFITSSDEVAQLIRVCYSLLTHPESMRIDPFRYIWHVTNSIVHYITDETHGISRFMQRFLQKSHFYFKDSPVHWVWWRSGGLDFKT